jgi:5-methylthioadenosine/S-adenosylhomocysteine deaminase
MPLLVEGALVPLDATDLDRHGAGWVLVDDAGLVADLGFGRPPSAARAGARRVSVGRSWVFPGVIDLHNHIGYNTLPLWTEPSQTTPFRHHNDWTDEPTYQPDVTWPAQTLATCAPEGLMAYAEVKALIGGTTAIQGSPSASKPRDNCLVRNIDEEEFGTGDRNLVYTSVLTLGPPELRARAATLRAGRGFIYHCAEGAPGSVVAKEYSDLRAADCLQERLIGVHCTAVTDFRAWEQAPGAVVWSPFSNLWLYGLTTDVTAARAAGLLVCLGSDWSPSGTKHVLAELKVADLHNTGAGLGLTDLELVQMVTTNPGDALSRFWPHSCGRIAPGGLGDFTIVSCRSKDPWRDLITTREADVRLVVVGGEARYGATSLMTRAKAVACGPITVRGLHRSISIPHPDDPTRHWRWSEIRDELEAVRAHPSTALAAADARAAARAAGGGPAPLELTLDMPTGGGGQTAGPPRESGAVVVPPLDGLTHDRAWLASIRGRGFHGGALDALAGYYR